MRTTKMGGRWAMTAVLLLGLLPQVLMAQGEIGLMGNGNTITDGATGVSVSNHTDFGAAVICPASMARTFTIENSGAGALTITGISVSGAGAGAFVVSGMSFPTVLSAAGSATFTVQYTPLWTATDQAVITVMNDDADESSYDFAIQGEGTSGVTVTATVNSNYNGSQTSCYGATNGSAIAVASGGTPAYAYQWSAWSQTAAIATSLGAGVHTVTATDANGCQAMAAVTVTSPNPIAASIAGQVNVMCTGAATGSATAVGGGGVGTYTFMWSNGQITATATALVAGSYAVTVTDVNGCMGSANAVIYQPTNPVSATIVGQNNVLCAGTATGTATAAGVGGTPPYMYLWSNVQTTATATALVAGTYMVTVIDANNCAASTTAVITQPAAPLVLTPTITSVSCNGGSDGAISLGLSGGTGAVTYLWTTGSNTNGLTGLAAGTYGVTITDANGCTVSANCVVPEPTPLSVTATASTAYNGYPISCAGAVDGSATAVASGGNAPYVYWWDAGTGAQITTTATGLQAGSYTVTAIDAKNCTATTTVSLVEPTPVMAVIVTQINATCQGMATGALVVAGVGGVGAYAYQWNTNTGGQQTTTATGLAAGVYEVTITDANGCMASTTGTVSEPMSAFVVDAGADVTIALGGAVGLNATFFGGSAPASLVWSPTSGLSCTVCFNPTAAPMITTEYIVTGADANGCEDTDTVVVTVAFPQTSDTTQWDTMDRNGQVNGCLPVPWANPLTYTVTCTPLYGTFAMGVDSCYQYNANGIDANVVDTVCVEVCDGAICSQYTFYIPIGTCVWSGDTDTNNVVNNMDLLPIGLGIGETGAARQSASNNYLCQPAFDWANSTPTTAINYKHSDTDGDGIVSNNDTMAIVLNWGQVHLRGGGGSLVGDIPVYIDTPVCVCPVVPGQSVAYPVMLGDAGFPVTDGYGFAFTLNYNPQQIEPGSVWLDFGGGWLGDITSGELIALQHDYNQQGQLPAAMTRTNGLGANGYGQIGTLHFTIKDDILRSNLSLLEMAFTDIRLITAQAVEIGTNPQPMTLTIADSLTAIPASTPIQKNIVHIFPNPADKLLNINAMEPIAMVSVWNSMGQSVARVTTQGAGVQLSVAEWGGGIYWIEVRTQSGVVDRRRVVIDPR